MPLEVLDVEDLKKERAALKGFLFGYEYGMTNGKSNLEAEAMKRRFLELTELLRPKVKA